MFVWRYLDPHAKEVGTSESFQDQEAAEAWLTAEWTQLSQQGVTDVELFDESADVVVYRMSLESEEPEGLG